MPGQMRMRVLCGNQTKRKGAYLIGHDVLEISHAEKNTIKHPKTDGAFG